MQYILSYKGKTLGQPMTHEKAEIMLKQLSLCMNNLEIVAYKPHDRRFSRRCASKSFE
ncbi:hypothetical protein LJK87_39270 [Paenibacillus sp. P25]|nr:hypothetical protein LJK87_39270 [Paenibacillus sp. P25]